MKKAVGIFLLVIFLIISILIWIKREDFKHIKRDWKIGIVTPNGWGMVTISPGRRMVNSIKIDKKVNLWIPGEIGWASQDKVDKKSVKNVFFYNFGFVPDKIEYLDQVEEWNKSGDLLKTMGLLSWINFSYMRDRMIFNDDVVNKDLTTLNSYFNEVMMRDFADTELINDENVKLTVINSSQENGLAGFVSSRLEWAGMSVVSSGNENRDIKDSCLVALGPNTENSVTEKNLMSLLNCKTEKDVNLADGEIELYFGENFAKVLKYSSYVRTF